MAPNPMIMQAVEKLDYRVTAGDIASQAGLNIQLAEQGLLALASEAGGHLQVSDAGEIAYLFPKNFRSILQSKYVRLRLQEWWNKVWKILFYIIRVSFGILLIVSILLIVAAIVVILTASSSNRDSNDNRRGGGMMFVPRFWFGPDLFYIFTPNYHNRRYSERRQVRSRGQEPEMTFLEAVFSFLFGDGNPNAELEERRWQEIAAVIRNNNGAVIAEQIAPYIDELGTGYNQEYEEYMLPVLSRFNGRPEVSPDGQLVYHFPELQVTAAQRSPKAVPAYLKESLWTFSEATSGQITMAAGLGVVNFVGALVLGSLLTDGSIAAELGGLVAFVNSIYGLLLGYGVAFLAIPLIRYFWIKHRNSTIETRNEKRQSRAIALNQAEPDVLKKLAYARQFATQTIVSQENLAYTTETDLTQQELEQSDKIDAEWRRRLGESG